MSSSISDVPAGFAPLVKLDLPSPEEYRKRKVALISGTSHMQSRTYSPSKPLVFLQASLVRMARTCEYLISCRVTESRRDTASGTSF